MGNWQRITVGIISILIVVVILLILMLSQIENRQTMKGAAENEARYDIAMKKIVENEARNELEKIICPPKCKQYNLEQWVVNLDKNSVMTCICFDPSSGCEMGFMYDLMEGTTINYMDTCTVKQSNSLAPITSNEKQQEINDYSKRVLEQDKNEKQDWDEIDYEGFAKKVKEWNTTHPKEKPLIPEKEFFFLQHLQKIQAESPRGMQYLQSASEAQKQYQKMVEDAKAFKELEKGKKYDDKFLLKMLSNEYSEGIIQKYKDEKWAPSKILEKEAERIKGEASFYMEGYIGFERQKREIEKIYERADTIENVGVQRSAETLAEAAIYAYQMEKLKNIDKPMFIAPENMMAEWGYGSHPEELKNIIIKSREQMVKYLTEPKIEDPNGKKDDKGKLIMIQNPYYRKLDRKQAEKIAKDHIKATFDIGHANTWAKYFNAENANLSADERKKKLG